MTQHTRRRWGIVTEILGIVAIGLGLVVPPVACVTALVMLHRIDLFDWVGRLMILAIATPFIMIPAGVLCIYAGRELRRHRTIPNRCPECGYDLRAMTTAGCPECGWNR